MSGYSDNLTNVVEVVKMIFNSRMSNTKSNYKSTSLVLVSFILNYFHFKISGVGCTKAG